MLVRHQWAKLCLASWGMVAEIGEADRRRSRVQVLNPGNAGEDFSEKWDEQPMAYLAFKQGIREFEGQWRSLMTKQGNVAAELEKLFGEPVKAAFDKRSQRLQEERRRKTLGVAGGELLVPAASTTRPVPPNTFYGQDE